MDSKYLALCLFFLAFINVSQSQTAPSWPKQYTLNGTFILPYFDIEIPIDLTYDGINNRQVLDYYNGMDTYVWRFDIQTLYQVVPRIDNMTCFVSTGIGAGPMVTLLPDLSTWSYQGVHNIDGTPCTAWETSVKDLNRTAVYVMFVNQATDSPVQLILSGYDFVFGSHPDVYVFNYANYTPNYVDDSLLEEPSLCSNGSAIENTQARTLRAKAHLGQLSMLTPPVSEDPFHLFMSKHQKHYTDKMEYQMRRTIFNKNLRRIEEHNAKQDTTFKMAMNHLGDYTDSEIEMLLMPKQPLELKEKSLLGAVRTHTADSIDFDSIPSSLDWVAKGAVNKIKDQGICGSCWTFGTIGSIEGAWFVKTGDLLDLSEQQVLDCAWGTWGSGNSGCDGGFAGPAMQWIMDNNGVAFENDYRYLSEDHFCYANEKSGVTLTGYVNVTSGDEDALLSAVLLGPVAIAIDAAHPEFEYYTSGVYYNPKCSNTLDSLDHEVLVVGFGTEAGQDYWLVRNSWSVHWGDKGYIKMARNKGNNCGIATQATYPLV